MCAMTPQATSVVTDAIERVRSAIAKGLSLDEAASLVCRCDKNLALHVVETIGMWPASEPELAAIQRTW